MRILLLAGGGGTRLWPLSTEERPKQFLPLLSEKSLLAETLRARPAALARRLRGDVRAARRPRPRPSSRQRAGGPHLRRARATQLGAGDPRGGAALRAPTATRSRRPFPSDQTVRDDEAFRRALRAAGEVGRRRERRDPRGAARPGPKRTSATSRSRTARCARFVEKPDREKARELAASGRHLWNAGIFVFRPSRLLARGAPRRGELLAGGRALRRERGRPPTTRRCRTSRSTSRSWRRSPRGCAPCRSTPAGATSGPGARSATCAAPSDADGNLVSRRRAGARARRAGHGHRRRRRRASS